MPLLRPLAALLAALLAASPVSAQEAEPATPSPEPAPTAKPKDLGGAWRRTAAGPFGAVDLPGGWTGTELIVADPVERRRAAVYLPTLDRWNTVAKPPRKIMAGSVAHWTGSELIFVEPRGTTRRGLVAYDPVSDAWRTTTPSPINEIAASVWAGDALVVTSVARSRAATYDPATDAWAELPALEGATPSSLHWTGRDVLALATVEDGAGVAFVPLDLGEGAWGDPAVGPLGAETAPEPLWIGDAFVFHAAPGLAGPDEEGFDGLEAGVETVPIVDARYEPATESWVETENRCGIDTTGAVWTGSHVLSLSRQAAWEPGDDICHTISGSPWPERAGALQVWTGDEVLEVGGDTGGRQPRRDGVAYEPFPQDQPRKLRLDKGSRPVRVRVPSLGIDLPVVWDGRKIPGGSPGYPACDVAEYWSAFGEPGEPGTTWILAHAQRGMFLPLLTTLNTKGKDALLGRKVQVQLRDGRLLTYRTYKANANATNTKIGTRNLKKGEHRLVLQTSTGVGSDPKLLVAARLVGATTTDEPRPKPSPRACG